MTTYNSINAIFTFASELAKKFMNENPEFQFSFPSMTGSQGELGSVDLTNGKIVRRILIDSSRKMWMEHENIHVTVEDFNCNEMGAFGTLWNHRGTEVESHIFMNIKKNFRDADKFIEVTKDKLEKIDSIKEARMKLEYKGTKRYKFEVTPRNCKAVLPYVKKIKGLKSVRPVDVTSIEKFNDRYYITVRGKRVEFDRPSYHKEG